MWLVRCRAMARTTIGLGFPRTREQEQALRDAAAALPDGWTIEMSEGSHGVNSPGTWSVRVCGPGFDNTASFGPDGVDAAIRLLRKLNPTRQG